MSESRETSPSKAANIQANLVRASRFADGKPRNWTLFFFFRIMSAAEIKANLDRIQKFQAEPTAAALRALQLDFANPSLTNAGLRQSPAPEASDRFRYWLQTLASGDPSSLAREGEALKSALYSMSPDGRRKVMDLGAEGRGAAADLSKLIDDQWRFMTGDWGHEITDPDTAEAALGGSLVGVTEYEVRRQAGPAFRSGTPMIRSEEAVARGRSAQEGPDPVGVNIAFTWHGLRALGIEDATLASFPEPFRQGMARRAGRLHDIGPSAPAGWDGPFGLPQLHGYFTGGFLAGGSSREVPEAQWRKLRQEIAAFNAPDSEGGLDLRTRIGALFRPVGLEIIHLELGQDPYDVDGQGIAKPRPYRVEHFGFRDGLSQPFADLDLGDTDPGGGAPGPNRTWTPVAPGELYLDMPDEDGETARLPVNDRLRRQGTYIAFRKLEQDVVGFRSFIARQTSSPAEANHLAAEFVGRWPSGAPLVLSPDVDRAAGKAEADGSLGRGEYRLNDFLYAADDPQGTKCPLGAHIRRANPRDTGGRDEVRRHRLLRRGVAYGGSLLPEDSLGDGTPRGLLFLGISARPDLQFEVIQADWLNGGEFLGQAGLGKCPVTGAHDGGRGDSFVPAGGVEPITGIPRFVVCRGGEYFFAPGIDALKAIADGDLFPAQDLSHGGLSLGDVRTQGLFDPPRLQRYGAEIVGSYYNSGLRSAIALGLPVSAAERRGDETGDRFVFIGRREDVLQTLSGGRKGEALQFSVEPYHTSAQRMTRGHDFVISTDNDGAGGTRERLQTILNAAWKTLETARSDARKPPAGAPIWSDIAEACQRRLAAVVRRCGPVGRIDLVGDLALAAAHAVVTEIYGVPTPDWMTELAAALPFGQQHLSELPADWLRALKASGPRDPGLISLQTWSAILLGDTIANLPAAGEAQPLSRQAGAEMITHIDQALAKAPGGPGESFKLVDAFVANADQFVNNEQGGLYADRDAYLREAAVVLAEITADTIAATPSAFGSVAQFLLDNNVSPSALRELGPDRAAPQELLAQVIYECDRLNPVLPVLQRLCLRDAELPSHAKVSAGDRVATLMGVAGQDPDIFHDPISFRLDRPTEHYLMFGAPERICWGQRIAMAILTPCLGAAMSLNGLRRVAGDRGNPQKLFGLTLGLPARFTPGPPGSPRR